MPRYQFTQFFSLDSPKAIKARAFGYMNAINYMAPHRSAGVGDLCGNASAGCIALCLGEHSGQAAMHKEGETNAVLESRRAKSVMFMRERARFMIELAAGIERAERKATREGLALCVRLNGATDIAWESVKVRRGATHFVAPNILAMFPHIQFVDYTKNAARALTALQSPAWPSNYHLTFSRSETNEADCKRILAAGGNVAVVFGCPFPETYLGRPVVNGDEHDLRHLDRKGGVIIGLSPKGRKAKRDASGFVVWSCDLGVWRKGQSGKFEWQPV